MLTNIKAFVDRHPAIARPVYAGVVAYREGIVDRQRTAEYRRRHPVSPEVADVVAVIDREGFQTMPGHFDAATLQQLLQERDRIVARVEAGAVDARDVNRGRSGSYRLNWRREYGEHIADRFFANPFFERIATTYLGGRVRKGYEIFQRSLPNERELFGTSGFHFDYETRTLKVFLYLTDVAPENGPLCFVSRTVPLTPYKMWKIGAMHVSGTNNDLTCSPAEERRLRLPDRAVPLTSPTGTLIFVDTRGFHKAGALTSGHRDVLVSYFARA